MEDFKRTRLTIKKCMIDKFVTVDDCHMSGYDSSSVINPALKSHSGVFKGGANTKKDAVFMMCIVNDQYVLGACIAIYCHRKMLEKAGLKEQTDLVIMCDEKIYDTYQHLLRGDPFFDRVEKIDIRTFQDAKTYNYSKIKYSSWIGASLNKWQIFRYDEYRKIMFVDVALLPVSPDFYKLFDKPTPLLIMRKDVLNDPKDLYCSDGQKIDYERRKDISYDTYLQKEGVYGTIHGNLVIIEPSMETYNEYVKLTDDIYKDGIYSIYKSGPDETSLYYFLMKKGYDVFSICHENATIPWDEHILIDISKGYEFSSMFKPWIKPKILCWPEEVLWRDIYEIIVKRLIKLESNQNNGSKTGRSDQLRTLFKDTMLDTYMKYMKADQRTKVKNFNDKYVMRVQKEFNAIQSESDPDKMFDALMRLDTRVYVKYYGKLKTDTLISVI
ncbi:putative transferase [Yasminevirus sp. GU-2018]|uniref:Putative transferase n=1 Tax=Yasminevirus sp. GU-2018 TaxID=2420051 RepID=A0A5K0U9K8_9VIRU|nr:putative transferase [Yasminevirus sp. GU-2018]